MKRILLVEVMLLGLLLLTVSACSSSGTGAIPTVNPNPNPNQSQSTGDTLAPETEITQGPGAATSDTTAVFEFRANEAVSFECRLDNAAFSACSSPYTIRNLAEGAHRFEVRATDPTGNLDASPAARQWTLTLVQATGATLRIIDGPQPVTFETDATFEFQATGTSALECSLNGAVFAACASPRSVSSLAPGDHIFSVRATPADGSAQITELWRWTVQAPAGVPPIALQRETAHGIEGFYLGQIGAADFDQDNRIDLVIVGSWDSAYTPPADPASCSQRPTCTTRIRLYRNVSTASGAIRFSLYREITDLSGCKGADLAVGDFNNDNRPDFAYQFHMGENDVPTGAYINGGGWNFTRVELPGRLSPVNSSLGIESADIDLDGRDDLALISSETISGNLEGGLWYRYIDNNWVPMQQDFNHYISHGGTVALGDLNGDLYPELAVGGNSNMRFGFQDCSVELQYGHVFLNRGAALGFSPGRIGPDRRDANGQRIIPTPPAILNDIFYALRADNDDTRPCMGSDNASYQITDMDNDGSNDIIVAGSAPGFSESPVAGEKPSHYSLSVMFNDGTGQDYQTWQNAGIPVASSEGSTNSGVGNVELNNIAAGDLNGDGFSEIFIQGHRRNYERRQGPTDGTHVTGRFVIFDTFLMQNNADRTFTQLDLNLPEIGEGGQVMADFNNDGKIDLIFGGAVNAWHAQADNCPDLNTAQTIVTEVYRNTSGL